VPGEGAKEGGRHGRRHLARVVAVSRREKEGGGGVAHRYGRLWGGRRLGFEEGEVGGVLRRG